VRVDAFVSRRYSCRATKDRLGWRGCVHGTQRFFQRQRHNGFSLKPEDFLGCERGPRYEGVRKDFRSRHARTSFPENSQSCMGASRHRRGEKVLAPSLPKSQSMASELAAVITPWP
jgi:hypothetical protein